MAAEVELDAVRLARDCFGDNLALAFVGGSRARGGAGATSDVDVFVVTRRGDRERERVFADELRALHDRHGLQFEHCGEVFDSPTLDSLLGFTEALVAVLPAIGMSACYRGDCLLSVFRKGHVVFDFLLGAKCHVRDHDGLLPALEGRSRAYRARWPLARPAGREKLSLSPGTVQWRLAEAWRGLERGPRWADTPVGIGLERWFGDGLRARLALLGHHHRHPGGRRGLGGDVSSPGHPHGCPLVNGDVEGHHAYAAQCLAHEPGHGTGHGSGALRGAAAPTTIGLE